METFGEALIAAVMGALGGLASTLFAARVRAPIDVVLRAQASLDDLDDAAQFAMATRAGAAGGAADSATIMAISVKRRRLGTTLTRLFAGSYHWTGVNDALSSISMVEGRLEPFCVEGADDAQLQLDWDQAVRNVRSAIQNAAEVLPMWRWLKSPH